MTEQIMFKLFWIWEDEKEENWLREMANQGWHLKKINLIGRYVFEAGAPQDMAYRLDWFPSRKEYGSYLQLFRDAGWEHVLTYGSWQYFRKESVDGVAPEIFTDNASKIKKYQQIAILLAIFLVIWWQPSLRGIDRSVAEAGWVGWVYVTAFWLRQVLFLFFMGMELMLMRRIFQLRKTV